MSTFMQKKETVVRKWYILDAAGKPLGRTAVAAANLLRGKSEPEFTPMRMGTPAFLQAVATALTLSSEPILPGFILILSAPAAIHSE